MLVLFASVCFAVDTSSLDGFRALVCLFRYRNCPAVATQLGYSLSGYGSYCLSHTFKTVSGWPWRLVPFAVERS